MLEVERAVASSPRDGAATITVKAQPRRIAVEDDFIRLTEGVRELRHTHDGKCLVETTACHSIVVAVATDLQVGVLDMAEQTLATESSVQGNQSVERGSAHGAVEALLDKH